MSIRVFFPTIGLGIIPHAWACTMAKRAGFSGVEVLATSNNKAASRKLVATAAVHNLELHWHQPWSRTYNAVYLFGPVLHRLGILERDGYELRKVLPDTRSEPIVLYADRFHEAEGLPDAWLQTCSVRRGERIHAMSYGEFVKVVERYQPPIVFDTQHYLEWYFGVFGVSELPHDPTLLLNTLIAGWKFFGHLVKEIHLNNFDPAYGDTLGCNRLLNDGILPLQKFVDVVKASKWSGVVVPEVSPFHLYPFPQERMRHTRQTVQLLFL